MLGQDKGGQKAEEKKKHVLYSKETECLFVSLKCFGPPERRCQTTSSKGTESETTVAANFFDLVIGCRPLNTNNVGLGQPPSSSALILVCLRTERRSCST